MGLIRRAKTGMRIISNSLVVTREHPRLVVFSVFYGVSVLTFFIISVLTFTTVLVGIWVYDPVVGEQLIGAADADSLIVWVPFWLFFYFGTAVVTTFFNAALVHEATRVFAGDRSSIRRGLRAAWRVRRKILVWGVASSLVNTFLIILDEFQDNRNPVVREAVSLLQAVIEVSWWVLTFFIVPVMLFRETTVKDMFKTSGRTFVDTWGETASASLGIWLLWLVVSVLVIILSVVGVFVSPPPLDAIALVLGILSLTAILLVRATAEGVIKAGLWQYATTGTMPGELTDIDWEEVFVDTTDQGRAETDLGSPGRSN